MEIPAHLNILSIPILLVGIFILFKYKYVSNLIYSSYSKKFETFMDGQFKDNYVNGYGKNLSIVSTIFVGLMIILGAFLLSFGPITIG